MLIALVRDVSPHIGKCNLTYLKRSTIDVAKARAQHWGYKRALKRAGAHLVTLAAGENFPDGVFVEDLAVVVGEAAVINRMGAKSRRREADNLPEILKAYRQIKTMSPPATLDGGDVLRVGRTLFVGQSPRTNSHGTAQLRNFLTPYDYRIRPIAVKGCLHLKTACSYLGRNTLLVNRSWIDASAFSELELLDVHPEEPRAANAVLINGRILYPGCFPETLSLLKKRGFEVHTVETSELMKAEAGVTCMSILFEGSVSSF